MCAYVCELAERSLSINSTQEAEWPLARLPRDCGCSGWDAVEARSVRMRDTQSLLEAVGEDRKCGCVQR